MICATGLTVSVIGLFSTQAVHESRVLWIFFSVAISNFLFFLLFRGLAALGPKEPDAAGSLDNGASSTTQESEPDAVDAKSVSPIK